VVVHPGAEIGHHLERPALASAIEFKPLFLPFQIILLIVGRNAGVGDGFALCRFGGAEQFRTQLGEIVAPMPPTVCSATILPDASQRRSVEIATPSASAASLIPTILSILHRYAPI
jgi:hypothetical protein